MASIKVYRVYVGMSNGIFVWVTVSKVHRLDRCNKNEMYACSGSCMVPYRQAMHSETGKNKDRAGLLTSAQQVLSWSLHHERYLTYRPQSWRPAVNFLARSGDRREQGIARSVPYGQAMHSGGRREQKSQIFCKKFLSSSLAL